MPYARRYKPVGFASKGRRIRSQVAYGKAARSMGLASKRTRAGYGSVARTRGAAVTGEMKYFDCDLTATAIAATTTTWVAGTILDPTTTLNLGDAAVGTPACIFAPKVSASLNGRIGRKVVVKKIKLRGLINIAAQASQGAGDSATIIRVLLVQDMQTNAAQMTGAQLMNDGSAAATTINSYQNPNQFGRFRVLKDKIITVSNANMAGSPTSADVIQNGLIFTFKFNVNFKGGVQVNFNATNGGTVADIIDNSFHVLAACNNNAYAPTLSYYTRVAYKE